MANPTCQLMLYAKMIYILQVKGGIMNTEKIKGTKTEQALINSFAGESMGRNKYTFFAKQAKKEGYEQIAEIFLTTAENEKEHAKLFYSYLDNPQAKITGAYALKIGTTKENLEYAISGEHEEWSKLYLEAEEIAKSEGFEEIAETFKYVRKCEAHHEERFKKLYETIKADTVFKKEQETEWMCRKCGYVHKDFTAPEMCPNCHHPKAYFQVLCENY